jgi:hypothetical protein
MVTTKVLQKVVWAGANNGSFSLASQALSELAEVQLSPKQVRRLVKEVGEARVAERDAAVEQLKSMTLPARRRGSQACTPPALAVISMDGGRYQRRDNFRGEPPCEQEASRKKGTTHWRETKVGCLLSMEREVHACDPMPDLPEWLLTSEAVAELAKIAEKTATSERQPAEQTSPAPDPALPYEPPELLSREVLASSADAECFGWQLEARAWQLGFPAAAKQVFVADGLPVNWTIQRRHFPKATAVLDLMHALSYAYSAAAAVDGGASYPQWAQWIWQGKVSLLIAALSEHQQRLGKPPDDADASDPRERVHRALTYYTNNQSRMNYPLYRQQGLPLTSSHIESTVKQINQRIKGTEKFWRRDSGEAVLQLRADTLSDSLPLQPFWHRWQARQTGANRYHTAA